MGNTEMRIEDNNERTPNRSELPFDAWQILSQKLLQNMVAIELAESIDNLSYDWKIVQSESSCRKTVSCPAGFILQSLYYKRS